MRALWNYLDRELDEPEMVAIDAHMARCEHCRAHAAFERRLIDEIRALRQRYRDPAELRLRVLNAIRTAQDRRP